MKRALFALCGALLASPALAAPCVPAPGAICMDGEAIDRDALLDRLRATEIVILGERHDNPVHHEIQVDLTAAISPEGLAFEMVPRAKEDAANAARRAGEDLAAALDWANSGWPEWSMYAPIFAAAPEARITGGGVPRDMLRSSVKIGAAMAWGEEGARYRLLDQLPMDVTEAMIEEQRVAHCDGLPKHMLPGMVEAQQLRDAHFADAVLRLVEGGRSPAVLITGNGHARTDRGSPLYLRRAAPERTVFSVGIVETEGEATEIPYDAIIYTAPHEREDPCVAFLKSRQTQ